MFGTQQASPLDVQIFTDKLKQLDLGPIAYKLMHPSEGEGWTYQETNRAIARYLRFLYLIYLYPNRQLVPTQDIDRVWHHHILDTMQYAQDCQMLFGRFIHHFPYLGQRGESDRQALQIAFKQTQALFQEHFGVDAAVTEEFVKVADCQPLGYATQLTRPCVDIEVAIGGEFFSSPSY